MMQWVSRALAVARQRKRLAVGLAAIAIFALAGLFAPLVAPFDPVKQDYNHMLIAPAWPYLLGTDDFGRDILSRLIWGGRVSLAVTGAGVLMAAVFGIPIGLTGAYYGGSVDVVLMRFVDLIIVFPPILFALTIVALFGPSLVNLAIVIGVTYFTRFARLAYTATQAIKSSLFVEASRALGARDPQILFTNILPNILPPLLVQAALAMGFGIILESGLSFLGYGVQPPAPSWGLMVADARNLIAQDPLDLVWPALTITVCVFAFNTVGDALRDVLDPRLRVR